MKVFLFSVRSPGFTQTFCSLPFTENLPGVYKFHSTYGREGWVEGGSGSAEVFLCLKRPGPFLPSAEFVFCRTIRGPCF